jgi:hypothetical protein
MPSTLSHLALAAALGIAALATGCPPPTVDLGPYTGSTGSDPSSGEGDTSATPLTGTDGPVTDAATTTLATAADTGSDIGETTAVTTTDASTTAITSVGDTTTSETGTPGECGEPDPLHPFPAPYVVLDGETVHGSCTLTALPAPELPGQQHVRLLCPDEVDRPMIVNFTILEGPLPDMTALIGKDFDVDINIDPSETSPERHWIVLSRDQNLVYASVRGHTLLGDSVEGDAYAPLAFDTADSTCMLAPTTPDWPPADPQGFACELAAPIFLGVRVNQDPKLLLKAGTSLEAPVVGGKYRLEVRAVTSGNNCIPGFPPATDVDTFSFAVALQPD